MQDQRREGRKGGGRSPTTMPSCQCPFILFLLLRLDARSPNRTRSQGGRKEELQSRDWGYSHRSVCRVIPPMTNRRLQLSRARKGGGKKKRAGKPELHLLGVRLQPAGERRRRRKVSSLRRIGPPPKPPSERPLALAKPRPNVLRHKAPEEGRQKEEKKEKVIAPLALLASMCAHLFLYRFQSPRWYPWG